MRVGVDDGESTHQLNNEGEIPGATPSTFTDGCDLTSMCSVCAIRDDNTEYVSLERNYIYTKKETTERTK